MVAYIFTEAMLVNIGESSVSIFAVFISKITQKRVKKKKQQENMALDIVMRDNPLKPPNNLGRPHVETRVFGWGE